MASLVFDTCCGCIKLRTGCFIIGYLILASELIATILTVIQIVHLNQVLTELSSSSNKNDVELQLKGEINTLKIVVGALLLFIILSLVFAITPLVVLHKNKRGPIKAFLIYGVIFIVISIILLIVRHVMMPIISADTIYSIVKLLFDIYFLLVIRSHYIKLGEVKERPVYNIGA